MANVVRWATVLILTGLAAAYAAVVVVRHNEALAVVGWLLSFPLTTATLIAIALISWNRLGGGLGLNDLFWHRNPLTQFCAGVAGALLVCQTLLTVYLTPDTESPAWLSARLNHLRAM